jgi:hypothetical protein
MLTNLNWIAQGKPFPPKQEIPRLERYADNERLFDGRHVGLFLERYKKVEEYLKKRHFEPDTIFNYPQLLTKKTADFVCGEPPTITVKKQQNEDLNAALDKMGFDHMLYEAVMDISRFGDSPFKVMDDRVSVVSPDCWFPIVDPTDLKRITQHVIAFPTEPDDEGRFTRLYVEIHGEGTVETRTYRNDAAEGVAGASFGALLERRGPVSTNMDGFAVQVLKNVSHSKSVYGMDDYGIVRSVIGKIIWRLHCMDTVLDKHSEPSLSGPESALSLDDKTGLYFVDLGNYFKRHNLDDPEIKYLTWDGNLDSSFEEIKLLLDQLYILSEMGAAFLEGGGQGTADSGTAIRLRMTSPRVKAQRIAGINTQAVKRLIAAVGRQNGIKIDPRDVAVDWHDGIPDDPRETLDMRVLANGDLPVESHLDSIKIWNECDDKEAAEIQEQIWAEQAAQAPYPLDPRSGGHVNDAGGKVPEET